MMICGLATVGLLIKEAALLSGDITSAFFFGVLLSTLNLLPVPFYVFASMSIASAGYFHFGRYEILNFVLGVVWGSFAVFYIYIVAFESIEKKTQFLMRNINTIIGSVTLVMALFTLFKLVYQ